MIVEPTRPETTAITENRPPAGGPPDSPLQPDPETAAIMARHAAGEVLQPREYGKLSGFARKVKRVLGVKYKAEPQPAKPAATPAKPMAPVLAPAVGPVEALDDGETPITIDAGLVKRTTAALLKQADSMGRRYVGREARRAGADNSTLARFDVAASLPVASQELIADVSPDVLAGLGLDPRHYPITVVVSCLGLWASNLWLCVDELKTLQARQAKPAPAPAPDAQAESKPSV